jgi:hypothetical protein
MLTFDPLINSVKQAGWTSKGLVNIALYLIILKTASHSVEVFIRLWRRELRTQRQTQNTTIDIFTEVRG